MVDAATRGAIHGAIARQLSQVYTSLELDIIEAVVEANGGDATSSVMTLEEMSPSKETPSPRKGLPKSVGSRKVRRPRCVPSHKLPHRCNGICNAAFLDRNNGAPVHRACPQFTVNNTLSLKITK